MIQKMFEDNILIYVLAGLGSFGLIVRFVVNLLYKHLIKESDNLGTSNSKLLKRMKLKFETCYKLKIGVNNVDTFVDKSIYHHRCCGILLSTWESLCGQVLVLSLLLIPVSAIFGVVFECGQDSILYTVAVGVLSSAILVFVDNSNQLSLKKRVLKVNLIDYFDNFYKIRLEQETFEPEMLEQYRKEYFESEQEIKKKQNGKKVQDNKEVQDLEKKQEGKGEEKKLNEVQKITVQKDEVNRRREARKKREEEKLRLLREKEEEHKRLEERKREEERRLIEERKKLAARRREAERLRLEAENAEAEARRLEIKKPKEESNSSQTVELDQVITVSESKKVNKDSNEDMKQENNKVEVNQSKEEIAAALEDSSKDLRNNEGPSEEIHNIEDSPEKVNNIVEYPKSNADNKKLEVEDRKEDEKQSVHELEVEEEIAAEQEQEQAEPMKPKLPKMTPEEEKIIEEVFRKFFG